MTSTENSVGIGAADAPNTPQDAAVIGLLERLDEHEIILRHTANHSRIARTNMADSFAEAASVIRRLQSELATARGRVSE